MLPMKSQDFTNLENQPVFAAFNIFLQKLKNEEWLSRGSKEEIKCCLNSAKTVEKMLVSLEQSGSLDTFLSLCPNLYGFEKSNLVSICDTVLDMVLSAPGMSLACVRTCVDEYFVECGSERFEKVLSSLLFTSDVYRVLLDYIIISDGNLNETGIRLQSQLISRLWKHESDTQKLIDCFHDWIKLDVSGKNIAIALMVISSEDESSLITFSLVFVFTRLLLQRGDLAMLFWKIFMELPFARSAVEKSRELRKGLFGFLRTSGQWMEATPSFTWLSREEGPCQAFGFKELVSVTEALLQINGDTQIDFKDFLSERTKLVGCTLWDDVEMRLNC